MTSTIQFEQSIYIRPNLSEDASSNFLLLSANSQNLTSLLKNMFVLLKIKSEHLACNWERHD